jgi:hypothetical protein
MKKYILTVFGDFNSNKICQEIALALSPLVDSTHLKFQYTNGILVFHFASEMDMVDIHEFLEVTSYGLYESFILSEFTDKVSVFMPEHITEHLFDLDNVCSDCTHVTINKDGNPELGEDMEENDEFVALLLNELKGKLKQPTIDQLLDKISSQGIQSLTAYEKGILDNYSK